jgi:hypothetical protein
MSRENLFLVFDRVGLNLGLFKGIYFECVCVLVCLIMRVDRASLHPLYISFQPTLSHLEKLKARVIPNQNAMASDTEKQKHEEKGL